MWVAVKADRKKSRLEWLGVQRTLKVTASPSHNSYLKPLTVSKESFTQMIKFHICRNVFESFQFHMCLDHIWSPNSFQIYVFFPILPTLCHEKNQTKLKQNKNLSRSVCAAQNIITCLFFHWSLLG